MSVLTQRGVTVMVAAGMLPSVLIPGGMMNCVIMAKKNRKN